MDTQDTNLEYIKAKNKVEKLKRFYTHLVVYIVINTVITAVKVMNNLNNGETFEEALYDFSTLATWVVWGIALAIHAFSVFGLPLFLGDDWEERKIEKYMNKELGKDKN
ncbi:2TM domain-containing protein [uncultured Winogradskyella sp.]|uniref:2TM domain-containing protein n=1 Tax=uncultured Winogradskyella sp. TaxID=395353 RepID=UPI0026042A70|nr:2TM domain-containing protein [uncultured Winogradskyella sp.]|tara:strand:- start:114 stop:440 length:327 start_codon:yes stop_codon:yes gene_type:complete